MPSFSATRSAVMPMGRSFIPRGRERAVTICTMLRLPRFAASMRLGAREVLSMPPATHTVSCPVMMDMAAVQMAPRAEAQPRSTVTAGTSMGMPAAMAATRAGVFRSMFRQLP